MEDTVQAFSKILNELCDEKGITQNLISFNWIRELSRDGKKRYIIKNLYELNSETSIMIADDKYATYEILNSNGISIIPHEIIFNPKTRSMYYDTEYIENVKKMLKKYDNQLIIKANTSCQGKDVFFCNNEKDAKSIINQLFEEGKDSVSVCPYIDIEYEYRVVFLDGKILYIYKKQKPYILGDGKNSISNLIKKVEDEKNIKFLSIVDNLDLNYIPFEGEKIVISWKHNLSNGAFPVEIDDSEIKIEEIKKLALDAGNAINIRFATVDIALSTNNKIYVMEINGRVCMNKFTKLIPNGYEIAKNIYSKALDKMFE